MADAQRQPGMCSTDREEPAATMREIAEMEIALGVEIARLRRELGVPVLSGPCASTTSGKPIWWWRAMLVSWVCAPTTRGRHPGDLLRGLNCALKEFEDEQLVSYLETIGTAFTKSA